MNFKFPFLTTILSLMLLNVNASNPGSNTANINFTIHGTGNIKVIVLHSWMDDQKSWTPVLPHLDLNKHTYAFVDVRGYGQSKHIKGNYNSDEIAEDVFSVADELAWTNFFLIGHSMTGMAVQKASLLDNYSRIRGIIAITPVSASGFPVDEENLGFFKAIVGNSEVANKAFRAFTGNRLSNQWYDSRSTYHTTQTDLDAQRTYITMWTSENFAARMPESRSNFLVLSGQYDHPGFVLYAQKNAFQNVKHVNIEEIENTGHFPMQETPVYLAARIERFFSEN